MNKKLFFAVLLSVIPFVYGMEEERGLFVDTEKVSSFDLELVKKMS